LGTSRAGVGPCHNFGLHPSMNRAEWLWVRLGFGTSLYISRSITRVNLSKCWRYIYWNCRVL